MTRPLKIAFVGQKGLPARWGGVETHVEAIATRLADRGHDVTAYVRRWYSSGLDGAPGVRRRALPTVHTKHFDAAIHSGLAAADTLLRPYDIVHFHAAGPSLFCWIPKLAGKKVVATIHGLDYRQDKWGPLAKVALRLGERFALEVADRVVVVSHQLQRHYANSGFATTYLANGVGEPTFVEPNQIQNQLGLAGADYLLFMGRWTPNKRLIELIRGYRQLADPSFKLVLAGADPEGGRYGDRVRQEARGAANVVLPGLVDGTLKAELLANARAVVSASDHEGLPIALLEAMSYGRPCLVSDIPAHREVLGDSAAGLVRNLSTPSAIASALGELGALSEEERQIMGQGGRARASADFDWDRVVDALEVIYADVVSSTSENG